ncbi:S8 family peptidase [Paenibacillus sp. MMS18-CY102]|uniref:S8 family peptidase n=1 Tax=Paenibacillus sp. MMS18-CY102 TaxID=2682849 RepID=UPI0013667A7A|nr:S8 family peptidase [Paenibacillus sp. MMS18-CY102]MWC27477.1 S8 family serine peptidase [Paenibacillus sp. MMS18-CY102]
MRGKQWIGWLAIAVAAILVIPFTPWFAPNKTGHTDTPSKQRAAAVKNETTLKLHTLQRDMDATAMLCTTECTKDFTKLASGQSEGATKSEKINHMMGMHPHMLYVSWFNAKRSVVRGSVPPDLHEKADKLLKQARETAAKGERFISKPFLYGGHRYFIIGVPEPRHVNSGVLGLVKQDVVGQVERHQRRNLRLVPYPAEGHYKIESVKANSTKETTVRTGEDNGGASHYHVNDVVVRFRKDPTPQQLAAIKRDVQADTIQKLGYTYVFRSSKLEAKAMMAYFRERWNPIYVEPHYLYMTNDLKNSSPHHSHSSMAKPTAMSEGHQAVIPNDALYEEYQWNLPSIDAEQGWSVGKGSNAVIVAVLDTGVQANHPDLKGRLVKGTNIVNDGNAPDDDVGHGTHVSGIIAASVNNGEGVAGLTWYNKIMPVKVLDSSGAGSTYSVAQGVIWATDHGAKVINMSLGNYAQADFLHDAVKYAFDHDVVIVAASGNDNSERPGYPAAYPEVLAVGATDQKGARASFSNYGEYIDVAAPGDGIASTYPGNQYAALSGTSMASPHVAALAALICSVNPELKNTEVMDIMRQTAKDLGTKGKDKYFGYGQIDIVKALDAAKQSSVSLQRYPQNAARRLAKLN